MRYAIHQSRKKRLPGGIFADLERVLCYDIAIVSNGFISKVKSGE